MLDSIWRCATIQRVSTWRIITSTIAGASVAANFVVRGSGRGHSFAALAI